MRIKIILCISCLLVVQSVFCQSKVLCIKDSISGKKYYVFDNSKLLIKVQLENKTKEISGKMIILNDSTIKIKNDTILLSNIIELNIDRIKIPLRILSAVIGASLFYPTLHFAKDGIGLTSALIENLRYSYKFEYLYGFNLYYCGCIGFGTILFAAIIIVVDGLILAPAAIGVNLPFSHIYRKFTSIQCHSKGYKFANFRIENFEGGKKSK